MHVLTAAPASAAAGVSKDFSSTIEIDCHGDDSKHERTEVPPNESMQCCKCKYLLCSPAVLLSLSFTTAVTVLHCLERAHQEL